MATVNPEEYGDEALMQRKTSEEWNQRQLWHASSRAAVPSISNYRWSWLFALNPASCTADKLPYVLPRNIQNNSPSMLPCGIQY